MKIIHCADIHLDSAMETHMTAEQASIRNAEIIDSFIRMTEFAAKNSVRAVIIAGDLFDGERVKTNTVETILDAIRRTPEVDYLYLAGNHDNAAHVFSDRELPKNLKQFGREWRTYRYDDVTISGIEIFSENASSLYQNIPNENDCVNIISLHGQNGTTCGVDKINLNLLQNKGIDYLALGHIHSYSSKRLDSNGIYCYSGCLEGRGFDECGEKGFVLLTIESGSIHHEFVPFCCRKLHSVTVDITGLTKNPEILQSMKSLTQDIQSNDMVEFILKGDSDPTANISVSYLQKQISRRFFFTKVKNESHMAINPEDYKNDISLKGEFIRLVLNSDISDEEKAAMIRLGIQALMGEEIAL